VPERTAHRAKRKGKRGDGEGHVKQLRNGRWFGVLSGGWADGKRIRKWFYGATQAEVIEKMDQARADLRAGHPLVVKRETVETYLKRWLEESARPRIKPRTYERFEELIRLHLNPAIGSISLQKLTPGDVQKLINQKRREGLAAQTVVSIRNVLRAALNRAIRWNLISRNVAALVDAPRIERPAVRALLSMRPESFSMPARAAAMKRCTRWHYPRARAAVRFSGSHGRILTSRTAVSASRARFSALAAAYSWSKRRHRNPAAPFLCRSTRSGRFGRTGLGRPNSA
jgi:hypothetical protein